MIAILQEPTEERGKAYDLGYELGYFVGENFYILLILALIIAVFSFTLFFRRKRQ